MLEMDNNGPQEEIHHNGDSVGRGGGKGRVGKPGQCQGLSDLRGRSIENKVMVLYPVLTHHLGPWDP